MQIRGKKEQTTILFENLMSIHLARWISMYLLVKKREKIIVIHKSNNTTGPQR